MSAAYGTRLRLDNEEVLQRFGAVKCGSKVCQVVTELHRFVVHTVSPASQHRHFGSRVSSQGIACIAEMFKRNSLIRFGGIQIL